MKCSVIVPTYNRGKKLRESILSIEKNAFDKKNFEILIINDCSTDKTSLEIKKLEKRYSNILGLKTQKNSGPASARNLGIKKAKGKILLFTDDDCLVPKNWLQTYWDFFEKYPEVFGIGGILSAKEENFFSFLEKVKDKVLGISHSKEKIGRGEIKTGFTNNCAYRRRVFSEIGFFDENFRVPAGEDLDFSQKVAKKHLIAFLPIKVLHNHKYNLDYFLGLIWKQGLGEMPPKKGRTIKLIPKIPRLTYFILKKIIKYNQ
jgi:glycosyltransferase involved in cell wall biosynthesis